MRDSITQTLLIHVRQGGRCTDPRLVGRCVDSRLAGRCTDPRLAGRCTHPRLGGWCTCGGNVIAGVLKMVGVSASSSHLYSLQSLY